MRYIKLSAVLFVAAGLVLAACAGAPRAAAPAAPLSGPLVSGAFPAESELSPFAREGLRSLSTFSLPNGIPVVVRRNDASAVRHLSLVIRGGSLAAKPETAGYELLALRTMARGSADYPYETIQSLLDETSAAMGATSVFEYSAYSLTALGKHFGRLLPVWADTLAKPAFAAEDFEQVLSEAKLALKSKEQDPWQRTGLALNAEFFAGHPYAATPDGTKESLAAADLEAVKAWYASSFAAVTEVFVRLQCRVGQRGCVSRNHRGRQDKDETRLANAFCRVSSLPPRTMLRKTPDRRESEWARLHRDMRQ